MNKTSVIKKIIGKTLEQEGFKYIRRERGIVWTFRRELNGVKQEVYIQQHTAIDNEYKIMLWSSAKGHGIKEIGNVIPEYKDIEYWQAETDEEFNKVINFFDSFIQNYGFKLLDEMLTEKADSFETPERKQYFKEHHEELVEKYDAIYHILGNGNREDQLRRIDEVLWEHREAEDTPEKNEEIYNLWLGLAAILIEVIQNSEGCQVHYDTWKVEIICNYSGLKIWPIDTVVQAWLRYHMNDNNVKLVWAMAR